MKDQIMKCIPSRKGMKKLPLIGWLFGHTPKVAVVKMSGIIADGQGRKAAINVGRFEKPIERAFSSSPEAVVLVINSPGGSPAQCTMLSDLICRLSKEKKVPVFAFIEEVAASGGYWLACCGDKVYALNNSIVGSIGVISAGFGFEQLIEKHGVTRRIYTSGKDKSFLDPFVAEKKSDITRLKKIQIAIHEDFKEWVKKRRKKALKAEDKILFEGGFWVGSQAVELGLIDGIGSMTDVMKKKYGKDVRFISYTPERSAFAGLFPSMRMGSVSSKEEWISAALDEVENRAMYSRYGL